MWKVSKIVRLWFVLTFFIMISLFTVAYGIVMEGMIGDGLNGAYFHLFIFPFLPFAGGLILKLKTNKPFLMAFLQSWGILTVLFYVMAFLAVSHYRFYWQWEWHWFWFGISIIMFIIQGIVELMGRKK